MKFGGDCDILKAIGVFMGILNNIFKRRKEEFGKDEVCFVAEAMDEPTLKENGKYVRAGYFKANKTQFVDLSNNRTYKCAIDEKGILSIDGKQMSVLDNKGEVYGENMQQQRDYRPLIKSKAGNYVWAESLRVAMGAYSEDMWVMFPSGDGYRAYFSFLLDDEQKMTIREIRQTVTELNESAQHIITKAIEKENENVNTL